MTQPTLSIIQEVLDTIKSIGLTGFLGIWGAIISTGLGSLKLLELWRERLQLSTTYYFTDQDHGNEIIIQNPSKTPVMISYWDLIWQKKRLFATETTEILDCGYPEGSRDINIGAYDTRTLSLDYFEWGYKSSKKGKLYLKLHIVGHAKP